MVYRKMLVRPGRTPLVLSFFYFHRVQSLYFMSISLLLFFFFLFLYVNRETRGNKLFFALLIVFNTANIFFRRVFTKRIFTLFC